jgi:hypothetical protein
MPVTGRFFVRAIRPAFQDAHRLCPTAKDRAGLRRHVLKLRFWPNSNPTDSHGELLDLDWEYIKCMPNQKVGELRIHDTINGNDNLRAIFLTEDTGIFAGLSVIWVLAVIQKKRQDFSSANITTFKARRAIVIERAKFLNQPRK